MRASSWLLLALATTACPRERIRSESAGGAADATPSSPRDAGEASAPLDCHIVFDVEEFGHMAAINSCLGDPRQACWTSCESSCTSCGNACGHDAACEAGCLRDRDACKTTHCKDVYTKCRTDMVTQWLSNKCDALCAPFESCRQKCMSGSCMSTCDAIKTASCNVYRCDEMLNAEERKTLDPKWKANDCAGVCGRVWKCAKQECDRSSCGEPGKMYDKCTKSVPGALGCGLDRSWQLCPEP